MDALIPGDVGDALHGISPAAYGLWCDACQQVDRRLQTTQTARLLKHHAAREMDGRSQFKTALQHQT